jgi:hypothetical protein
MNSSGHTGEKIDDTRFVTVSVYCQGSSNSYSAQYDSCTCVGELIRNLCVNLNIDPDTRDGVTLNVAVARQIPSGEFSVWTYNPHCSLRSTLSPAESLVDTLSLSFQILDEIMPPWCCRSTWCSSIRQNSVIWITRDICGDRLFVREIFIVHHLRKVLLKQRRSFWFSWMLCDKDPNQRRNSRGRLPNTDLVYYCMES